VAHLHLRPVRQQAGGGTLADPYLRLHASDGAVVAENDDIVVGINRDSQLVYTATATGAYYVEAGAFDDSYTGTYKASVAAPTWWMIRSPGSTPATSTRRPTRPARPIGRHSCRAACTEQVAQSYSVQAESTGQYAFLASPNASNTAAVRASSIRQFLHSHHALEGGHNSASTKLLTAAVLEALGWRERRTGRSIRLHE